MRSALVALAMVGCVATGAPPGFSSGSRWTFPLVDPLADGLLVTPVMINGKGPYLFAIDPDVTIVVDERVAIDAGLRIDRGYYLRPIDEANKRQFRFQAEVVGLKIGDLTIERRGATLVPNGWFDAYGRDIHGVIGNAVFEDSLVFGFDRDRGIAFVETQEASTVPPGAKAVHWDWFYSMHRKLAAVIVDTAPFSLHIALGSLISGLREASWAKAGLSRVERPSIRFDTAHTKHIATVAGQATRVSAGGVTTERVAFAPFDDNRYRGDDYDGILGLDFFRPYVVWSNWDKHELYLVPRLASTGSTTVRFARWGAPIAECKNRGCVTVHLIDPLANKPSDGASVASAAPGAVATQHPGVVFAVVREPNVSTPLEVTLAATNRADLPKLIVNIPTGVDRVMDHLPAEFVGADLEVVDVSPFPMRCPTTEGCVVAERDAK